MSVRVVLAAQAHALLYRSSRRVASRVCSHSDAACPVKSTRKWIRDVVVGLNLCPWAGAPLQHGDLRIVESTTTDALECARREFDAVAATENATVAIAILCAIALGIMRSRVKPLVCDIVCEAAAYCVARGRTPRIAS